MTPERQRLVHEAHPEVSFWALNGSKPVTYGKICRRSKGACRGAHSRWFPPRVCSATPTRLEGRARRLPRCLCGRLRGSLRAQPVECRSVLSATRVVSTWRSGIEEPVGSGFESPDALWREGPRDPLSDVEKVRSAH